MSTAEPQDATPAAASAVEAVLLLGPTASGKSDFALRLADALPLEIVSVDSAQVYRGLDIGTAKPTAAERARVAHHLIDLRDPSEPYSAAEFARDATRAIAGIRARGRLPLVVGGTMLYAKALREGLSALPSADAAVRARISEEAQRVGWPALHARLATVDPVTAARLAPTDAQRIQRALEVWRQTGRPISSFHRVRTPHERPPQPPLLSLEPDDRAWLHERIAQRFHAMLEAGFVDEVRALRARGDLHAGLPSMRCVGYRQAWEALETGTIDALPERGIAATRQLAKRQITWLRSMPGRDIIPADAPDAIARTVARAVTLARERLESRPC